MCFFVAECINFLLILYHFFLQREETHTFKCFLYNTDFFHKCTDIFFRHTSVASLTSYTLSFTPKGSMQISGGSKRSADECSTGLEVSSLRMKQKMKTDFVQRNDQPIPSFKECYDLVKAMPDIDPHIVVKIAIELQSIPCREMFMCLSPD